MKCFATTNSVMIDQLGKVKPCCKYIGNFGHIDDYDNIQSILNSDHYLQLRSEHAAGNFTPGCSSCELSERRGYSSRRTRYDTRFSENDFLLDVSPGAYCNLKCRMCSIDNSTSWFSDWDTLIDMGVVSGGKSNSIDVYSMPDSDVDKIIDFLHNTDYNIEVEFKGGEPLMNPKTKSLFEKMANSPNSKRISIILITNGTWKVDWLESLVPRFKKIVLNISADGVGNVYEYIRGNSSKYTWLKFLEVFEFYSKIKDLEILINFVVQNMNVHQMLEFSDAVSPCKITWIILQNPEYLSLNTVPESAKANIIDNIQKLIEKSTDKKNDLVNIITELSKPSNMEQYAAFIRYSAALDKIRKQSLIKVADHLITAEGKLLYDTI